MQFIKNNKDKIITIIYCFVVSFIILSFTSKCSFLYPFNDWVDANAFFTVGKSMMNGIVPYLDLFEQKGILLYLIYGIGYLISNTTFIGIFILEVISWTISLYYIYKIISLYLDRKWSYVIIPIFTTFICTSRAFVHGGSAEEFCLIFLSITLYYFLSYFKTNSINYKRIVIAGLCAGSVLLIKYTLLGFWFAFMACIFFCLILDKKYKQAILSCFVFLGGMLLPFLISMIYMIATGGLKEYIDTYFVINITAYGNVSSSLIERAYLLIRGFYRTVRGSSIRESILMFLMPVFLLGIKTNKKAKISIIIIYLFTILGIYYGLKFYRYYLLPVEIFELISLIGIVSLLSKYLDINKCNLLIVASLILSFYISYFNANYVDFRTKEKEELFQYQFAKEINKYKNPTLLNVGYLDCGVYTTTNILPTTYYFEKQNFSYERFPDNIDSLQKYIKNKDTMFVVYYTTLNLDKLQEVERTLFENYELTMMKEQEFEDTDFTAYLFIRKEA